MKRRLWCFGAAATAQMVWAKPAVLAQSEGLRTVVFVRHATFFSQETRRSPAIDPQIFVRDENAHAGAGPQGIEHVEGFRPARVDDAADAEAYNAQGIKLGFTVDRWFAAAGEARIGPHAAGDRISCTFERLIAFGSYSLFRVVFSAEGATFTPLDGAGTANNFTAHVDGSADPIAFSPEVLESGNAIVLIYHSDGQPHGALRGELGVTAHHELIARLP